MGTNYENICILVMGLYAGETNILELGHWLQNITFAIIYLVDE